MRNSKPSTNMMFSPLFFSIRTKELYRHTSTYMRFCFRTLIHWCPGNTNSRSSFVLRRSTSYAVKITNKDLNNKYKNLKNKSSRSLPPYRTIQWCKLSRLLLNYKPPSFIPVVFHNLRNFDSHLNAESFGVLKEKRIKCIPQNMDKYISFSLGNLRFIDSFHLFMT